MFDGSDTTAIVEQLRRRQDSSHKATDILAREPVRALARDRPAAVKDLTKIAHGEKLSRSSSVPDTARC